MPHLLVYSDPGFLTCMSFPGVCYSQEVITKLFILHGHMHWEMTPSGGVCSILLCSQAELQVLQCCTASPAAHSGCETAHQSHFLAMQLKLREALLPEVVSQVDHLEGQGSSNGSRPQASSNGKKGKGKGRSSESKNEAPLRTWAANPKLFPCEVAPEAQHLVKEVQPCSFLPTPHQAHDSLGRSHVYTGEGVQRRLLARTVPLSPAKCSCLLIQLLGSCCHVA